MGDVINKNNYMNNILRYIENNITDNINIELLSSIGYVSRSKLKNDFYSVSGHSVIEYVYKRRLSNALALIKMSDMELTDIALGCGYSSHQALCRAVKQTLGLTPTEYKNSDTYYFFPPLSGDSLQSVTVSSITMPQMTRILFYHTKYIGIENMAVNIFLHSFPNYKGRIFGRNGVQKGNSFCYELFLTYSNIDFSLLFPYGFEIVREASPHSATFATTTVRNDEHIINTAWNYLYSVWLPGSMFEYTGEPYCEEFILRNNKPYKLKLYLPLRKRYEETKISLIDNPGLCFVAAKATGHNAEEISSQKVIEYLQEYYPHIINVSKEIYVQKGTLTTPLMRFAHCAKDEGINFCVCGVKISPEIKLTGNENVKTIFTEQNKYLVFETSAMGDYAQTVATLLTFAKDNRIDADPDGIFAVYDTRKGSHNLQTKMYCPVRICPK